MSLLARQGSKLRSPLARRLVIGIILASLAITLILTTTQLYLQYRSEVRNIDGVLRQIEDVHLKALSKSLWAANTTDLQLQLEGIIRIQNVELVEVREGNNVAATVGRRASSELVERQYLMTYVHRDKTIEIGTLTVVAGLDAIYRQLWREALRLFLSNAASITLVSIFSFLLFYRLVNRHLLQITTYMRERELDVPMSPLTLKRPVQSRPDEFDELVAAINLDGSRIKESRFALQKNAELLDSIVEQIPVMVFLKRASDLRFERFNRYGEELLGYSRNDLIGKSDYDFWTKEQAGHITAADRKALASSEITEIPEESIKIASGETRYLHTWKVSLRDEGGKPTYLLGISLDITERKQADAETAQLAAIVEASSDAIISRTLDGTILSWNPGAEKIFGYSSAEMIGKSVNLTVPLNYQSNLLLINDALLRGELVRREAQRITQDGRLIDVFASASPIRDSSGNIVAVSVIFQDITVRKRAEAERASLEVQLHESQKMQAIGTLAGGIAHDFNNILATILGNANLMRQDLTANPEAMESLEEISKASRRGRNLVQQILAFSRRQPVELKPMALAPLVEESARLLRSTLPASVSLQTQCGPDVPEVLANATQLQQVIINLAINAMQAMSGRPGRIDISLDTVVMDETLAKANPALRAMLEKHPGRAARLTVKDAGPGMDEDTLSRIFEPFFTTKAVNEGTGLGLSVVHGIVQSHQGVITVHSEVGTGTTFTIYLPLAAAETTAKLPDAPGAQFDAANELSLDGGKHVLYLDDDQFLVFLVKRLLERRGLRVSAYLDPGEALAALRANPASFDLVVSDYNMPEMSGLEVARVVPAIRVDLPVVMVSGFVDDTLQTQAKAAGVREVIFKAEAMDGFCEVIARVLNEAGNKSKTS